jgi:hypothetical protein
MSFSAVPHDLSAAALYSFLRADISTPTFRCSGRKAFIKIGEKPQQRPAFLVRCEQMSQRAEACRKKVKPTVRHGSF